ncbi:MAG TPA: STAS domain-containing protein [Solirubrobacteraceae bacterium]|jgi:anti-sigma B factor antagonist|nr:STAS domain-containing protein [Solirubrobacteraceae bacterium]
MHAPLQLRKTPIATDGCSVALAGELDLATAPQLRTAIGTLLGTGCRHVVLDLSETTFLDSSGLGALVWAAHRMRSAGGDFSVVHPNPAIVPTLEVTGVGPVLALDG